MGLEPDPFIKHDYIQGLTQNDSFRSSVQSAQDRAKWRRLIRRGTNDYQAKIVCEAEQNRKERKARAKGTSESSFSEGHTQF